MYSLAKSSSFIKKFIEEYNKGNIITNILVGYLPCECQFQHEPELCERLKVDSNNTITIKRLKPELYTREEVEQYIINVYRDIYPDRHWEYKAWDWIKQNI